MPRFSDDWVVDKTLFEHVSGGSCACCGFNHFLPDGTAGMIHAMSDLETDAANAEVAALSNSPWPPDMRDQVWGDRLRLRFKLKKEMTRYQQFWDQHHLEFTNYLKSLDARRLQQMMQMPRSELSERIKNDYKIHSAFAVVFCTVVEQVAHFPLTKYPVDARGSAETEFERVLVFDRRGGFYLPVCNQDGTLNEQILNIWFKRMESLGGPKLLERAPKQDNEEEEEDDDGGADDAEPVAGQSGPSFRSDRRLIRLMIARYWADQLMQKFHKHQQEVNGEST